MENRCVESLLSVEVEDPKPCEQNLKTRSARLVVLSRDPSGRFLLQQRLSLPEKTDSSFVTFTAAPNGNVLCGVFNFARVYELEYKQPATASITKIASTWSILKALQFPHTDCTYQCICGFRVGSEWRLAVSFDDDSVRTFALNGGALSEVCRLSPLPNRLMPYEILAVRPGALCIRFAEQNADNSWRSLLHYVEMDSSGRFLTPRRIHESNGNLSPLAMLPIASGDPHSRIALIASDTQSLCVRIYAYTE